MTHELTNAESLSSTSEELVLSSEQRALTPLALYLRHNIQTKLDVIQSEGHEIDILTPDWCRENATEAGKLHAGIIVKTYGSTYALPNKDPLANRLAIEEGNLDVYLLKSDGNVVGTACLVNMGDGRAELGRSASLGKVGNSIIQDLRILDWLVNPETSSKYHTLFTTLRSAPDRQINENDGTTFTMRGGQAVTSHWKKFPNLTVNGFGPLYLKHGALEQFSCATITRQELASDVNLFIADEATSDFINGWHDNYRILRPEYSELTNEVNMFFVSHYPPQESGLTELVHADIVNSEVGISLADAIKEVEAAGSPFTQVVIPINKDTRAIQTELKNKGYQVFGYQPAYIGQPPALIYGYVKNGVDVISTFWGNGTDINPFWQNDVLQEHSERIASKWKND